MIEKRSASRRRSDAEFRATVDAARERHDAQHKDNVIRFEQIERRLGSLELMKRTVDNTHLMVGRINVKIDAFNPDAFAMIVAEHESRAAVSKWLARCFSSTSRLLIVMGGTAMLMGSISSLFAWALAHIK